MNSITTTSPQMLEGFKNKTKVQHRVLMEPQPDLNNRKHRWAWSFDEESGIFSFGKAPWRESDPHNYYVESEIQCPFKKGERIFVGEPVDDHYYCFPGGPYDLRFTQEWDSRFKFAIKDIWPQKLSEMTEDEAVKEGFFPEINQFKCDHLSLNMINSKGELRVHGTCKKKPAKEVYEKHFNNLHGENAFETSWVWVMELGYE